MLGVQLCANLETASDFWKLKSPLRAMQSFTAAHKSLQNKYVLLVLLQQEKIKLKSFLSEHGSSMLYH